MDEGTVTGLMGFCRHCTDVGNSHLQIREILVSPMWGLSFQVGVADVLLQKGRSQFGIPWRDPRLCTAPRKIERSPPKAFSMESLNPSCRMRSPSTRGSLGFGSFWVLGLLPVMARRACG